ncbi:MAG: hypothetical protein E7365_03805 [Clostridiales bacterium]|nr:hypothetical protein [Clostridiales bacterium]
MAVSNKYARRRRNAVLAAIVMALVFIIIIVVIVSSLANKGGKTNTPTPTPTINNFFPTLPPASPTFDLSTPDGSNDLATPTPDLSAGTIMYVTGSTVNVRAEASTDSDKITSLTKGTSVTAYEVSNGFYEVKLSDGKKGYISDKYLSTEDPKVTDEPSASPSATPDTSKGTKMYVTGDGVNVRKSNSTSSDKVANLVKGKEVTAYAKVGDWTYIQYGTNKYGYISSKYLSDKAPTSATNAPTLTLKPSAGTTPAPTNTHAKSSFTEIGVPEKVALAVDGNTDYLKKASGIKGMNLGNEDGSNANYISYYKIGTTDGSADFYIVFKGTSSAPTWVDIQTQQPTNN